MEHRTDYREGEVTRPASRSASPYVSLPRALPISLRAQPPSGAAVRRTPGL
jgi:hypothetical protein